MKIIIDGQEISHGSQGGTAMSAHESANNQNERRLITPTTDKERGPARRLLRAARALVQPRHDRMEFSILVDERRDGSLSMLVQVVRHTKTSREKKQIFAVTDRMDPRLESYFRELADMAKARTLTEGRLTRRRKVIASTDPSQLKLL